MIDTNLSFIACFTDLDECASSSAVCEHDALCINLPGSYACQCKLGYLLTDSLCQGKHRKHLCTYH